MTSTALQDAEFEARMKAAPRRASSWPIAPLVILGAFVLIALFADVLAPHKPNAMSLRSRMAPPVWIDKGTWTHILGTDRIGRDILSRIMHGARVSLAAGVTAVLLGVFVMMRAQAADPLLRDATEQAIARVETFLA